jgi:hypothetical protein
MRARILLTDGTRTLDLFWVEHDGSDVYCGTTRVEDKSSYHASGKVHSDFAGQRRAHGWHSPLRDLRGSFYLSGLTIDDIDVFIGSMSESWAFTGKKADAVLLVDSRALPRDAQVQISFGLVEAGNGDALARVISGSNGGSSVRSVTAVVAASVSPWVCAVAHTLCR